MVVLPTLEEERMVKEAISLNPALLADDVMDVYVQYNAAKRSLDRKRKRVNRKTIVHNMPIKQAALEDVIEPWAAKVIANPSMLLPSLSTVGTIGAGVGISMYGPEALGGPSDAEILKGKRWDMKRALRTTATTAALGSSILRTPRAIYNTVKAPNLSEATLYAAGAVPGIAAMASISRAVKNKEPMTVKSIMKSQGKAKTLGFGMQAAGIACNHALREAIINMAKAAAL